jgi:hypothetical protein
MKRFHVWLRSTEATCKVRVDGVTNARWLLDRLGDSFVFKSSEPLDEDMVTACSSFHVQYTSQLSGPRFAKLLAAIPEVNLMLEPA